MTTGPAAGGGARHPTTIVAFTSLTGGIGRTGVVVNLAWVLTTAGKRVAIADWGTEWPRAHDYLAPFPADEIPPRELLSDAVVDFLVSSGPSAVDGSVFPLPEARRYRLPDGRGHIDVAAARDLVAPVPGFVSDRGGGSEIERLREGIRASEYDYVLIDAPTNLEPEVSAPMARLCDVVAVCFVPRPDSIASAAELARRVRRSAHVAVLAVVLQSDSREAERVDRAESSRTALGALLLRDGRTGRDLSAGSVDIPHHPRTTRAETLAVLVGEPSCLAAYRRLADAVVGHPVDAGPAITPGAIADYRHAVGLGASAAGARILLVYAPEDRPWADWVRENLTAAGADVSRLPESWGGDDGATVVVISPTRTVRSELGRRFFRALDAGASPDVVLIEPVVTAEPVPAVLAGMPVVELGGLDATEARAALLTRFPVVSDRDGRGAPGPGFPARPYWARTNLPQRLKDFTGRGVELEAMRDRLASSSGVVTWTLHGRAGVGKTWLAKEYAHRFAFDYVLVWWIDAQDRRTVTEGLAALARHLGLPIQSDPAEAVIRELSSSRRLSPWLLVYDHVDDPAKLVGLLPAEGSGHVVIVTRTAVVDGASASAVGAFDPSDSEDLLRGLVPNLSARDVRDVADLVDHLPLTLQLAGRWISESARALRARGSSRAEAVASAANEFRSRMVAAAEDRSTSAAASSGLRTVRIIVESMEGTRPGAAAVHVARLCGFLAPERVSLRFFRSPPVLAELSGVGALLLSDDLELDRVLWLGCRYGLFDVDWSRRATVGISRSVRLLLLESMTLEEQEERRDTVLRGLAALSPSESEVDNGDRVEDLRELGRHLEPSGATGSADPAVRRWIVTQLRYFLHDGDPETWTFAVGVAEQALANWEPADEHEVGLRMQMRFHLSNLWRALGDNPKALELDAVLLDDQRRLLGPLHPRALRTARGVAQGMRSLGNFDEALTEERAIHRGLRAAFGGGHPDTMRASNNLALSHFLAGATGTALDLERKNHARRLALLGPGHPDVWWSACTLGVYLRELGRHSQALTILRDALNHVLEIGHRNQRYELRIQWNRAIALRRSGKPDEAKARTVDALRRYRVLYGDGHPDVRACRMSLAADLHATGKVDVAVRLAQNSVTEYVGAIGTYHPFTVLCRMDLAVFLRSAGQVEQALSTARAALDAMRFRVGRAHPWTIAAANAHALALAATGSVDTARSKLSDAHAIAVDHLEPDHPITNTLAGNLAVQCDQWRDVVLDVPEM